MVLLQPKILERYLKRWLITILLVFKLLGLSWKKYCPDGLTTCSDLEKKNMYPCNRAVCKHTVDKKKKYIPLGPLCASVKRLFTLAGTTRHSVDKPYISVCRQQFEAAFVHFKERFMILGHFNIIYETEFLYIT